MTAARRNGGPGQPKGSPRKHGAVAVESPPPAGDERFLWALTAEHAALQSARSSTVFESNGRMTQYLSTVSGALIALGFVGQVSKLGDAFYAFAFTILPALSLLERLPQWRRGQVAQVKAVNDVLLVQGFALGGDPLFDTLHAPGQRARTAFLAIADRFLADSAAARAKPPLDAPSRERATAAWFRVSGGSGGCGGAWPTAASLDGSPAYLQPGAESGFLLRVDTPGTHQAIVDLQIPLPPRRGALSVTSVSFRMPSRA